LLIFYAIFLIHEIGTFIAIFTIGAFAAVPEKLGSVALLAADEII
jgi:hypothetical protein